MEVVSLDPPDAPFLKDVPCPAHALGTGVLGRFRLSPSLLQWLRANIARFDGIVMQGIWTFPGIAVRLAARRAGRPYCVFAHGALDPWFNKHYPFKRLKKKLYWPIQYPILRDAAAVLFTVNVTAVLPVTPANIGVFQAACAGVLHAGWHVSYVDGVAYGVILQAVEVSTAILMGMPALLREGLSWREIRLRALHSAPVKLPARPAVRRRGGDTLEERA